MLKRKQTLPASQEPLLRHDGCAAHFAVEQTQSVRTHA